jgi:RimJ/RimL family protein N-acetyltransferase
MHSRSFRGAGLTGCLMGSGAVQRVSASEIPLSVFVEAEMRRVGPTLRGWLSAGQIRANIEAWLGEEYGWIDDEDFGRRFQEGCFVPGTSPRDYQVSLFEWPSELAALAGIRFVDPQRPFVGVVSLSDPARDAGTIARVCRDLVPQFAVFGPRSVNFRVHEGETRGDDLPGAQTGVRYMAALVEDVASRGAGGEGLEVVRSTSIDFYEEYAEVYRGYREPDPVFADAVRVEDRETFEELVKEGTCFEVLRRGRRAGIVATDVRSDFCLSGHCVVEFLLWPDLRGRGFAGAILSRVATMLDQSQGLLYGTIDSRNVPALRAAERIGRREVACDMFIAWPPADDC